MERKASIRSIIKVALIVVAACIVLVPLIMLVGSFIVIGNEPASYKKELNNPIINADYPGWHQVELSNEETIMLPAAWSVTVTDSVTVMTDENGQVVARGGQLHRGGETHYQYDQLLEQVLGHEVTQVALTTSGNVRSSEYGKLVIAGEDQTEFHYILLAKASGYDMLFIVEPAVQKEHSNLIDIMEAVIFSYVWE